MYIKLKYHHDIILATIAVVMIMLIGQANAANVEVTPSSYLETQDVQAQFSKVEARNNLSQIKVASQYRRITDEFRSVDEAINIFNETKTEFIFQGWMRQNPTIESCSEVLPGQRQTCEQQGYTFEYLRNATSKIKTEMPNVLVSGGFLAEFMNPEVTNEVTGEAFGPNETWEMAIDPGKWGIPKSKDDFQKEFAVSFGWTQQGETYDPKEQMYYYFPDITNPVVKELYLSWVKKQIDNGVDAIWIDALYGQAETLYNLTGDINHTAVNESYEASSRLINEIHDYGLEKGRYIYVISWVRPFMFEAPYSIPDLDGLMLTIGPEEIQGMSMNEMSWDNEIKQIKEKFGDVPIFARIDYGNVGSPLAVFSQNLTTDQSNQFLMIADDFLQQRDIIFIYPIHGGNMGSIVLNASKLSYGIYDWYDSLAPEFQTYETIKEVALYRANDVYPPKITIQSPTNNIYNQPWVWANISLNKAALWCGVSLNGATNRTLSNTSTTEWNLELSVPDGENNVKFYCNNTAGRVSNSSTVFFTTDTILPSNITFIPPTENNNANISLNWYYVNVTFTEINPNKCLFNLENENYTMSRTGNNCYLYVMQQADGKYVYKVYVFDRSGNTAVSSSRTIILDTVAPSTIAIAPSGWEKSDFSIILNSADIGSGVYNTSYKVDNSEWTNGTKIKITNNGNHTVRYSSVDYAGNAEATKIIYAALDKSGPNVIINSPLNIWYNIPPQINGTATDIHSGIASIQTNLSYYSGIYETSPFNFTNTSPLPQGQISFNVTAIDIVGNIDWGTRTFNFDNIPPSNITFLQRDENNTLKASNWYFVYVAFTEMNLDKCLLNVGNVNYTMVKNGTNCYINMTEQQDGMYVYKVYVGDKAGNIAVSSSRTITLDTVAPSTTAIAPSEWQGSNFSIILNSTDIGSGVSNTAYRVDSNEWTNGTVINITNEGNHTVRYSSVDYAGNVEEVKIIYAGLDKSVPNVKIDSPLNIWYNIPPQITGTATDIYSGVASIQTNLSYYSGIDLTSPFSFTNTSPLPQGQISFNVTAIDNVGNINRGTGTFNFDNIAPSNITFVPPTENNNTSKALRWYFVNVTFTETNPFKCLLNVGNVNYTMVKNGNNCYINMTRQQDGIYVYKVYVFDISGNIGVSSSRTINLDTVAPLTTAIAPSGWQGSNFSIILNPTDLVSGVYSTSYKVDSNAWTNGTIINITNEGIHTVSYYSVDYAGNAEAIKNMYVGLDKSVPNVIINSPLNIWYNIPPQISGTATDIYSGVASIQTNLSYYSGIDRTSPFAFTNTSPLPQGQISFNVTAVDNAGNINWSTGTFNFDNIPPSNITFIPPTEDNNTLKASNWYFVNATFTETNPDKCLLNVGNVNYAMVQNGNNCYVNMTQQRDGIYVYKVYVGDKSGNIGVSSSRTIILKSTLGLNPKRWTGS